MAEKINTNPSYERTFVAEQEPTGPSLREQLLSSPENAMATQIPADTTVLRLNTELLRQTNPQFISEVAQEVAEENTPFTSLTRHHDIGKLGHGKLAFDTSMSLFDASVHPAFKKEENPDTLSFLYDGKNVDMDGETKIPSAVLVHEAMNEAQLQELRDLLPAGVPLIDAKTNKLLDETGQAEREFLHEKERIQRKLGKESLDAYYAERVREFRDSFYMTLRNTTEEAPSASDYDWNEWEKSMEEEGQDDAQHDESANSEEPRHDASAQEQVSYSESGEGEAWTEEQSQEYAKTANANYREREQKERDNYKMVDDAAREKYGRSVKDLNAQEKKSLRRDAVKKYHPDYAAQKDTIDSDKYEVFERILK